MTVSDSEFECNERVEDGAPELRKSIETFAPAWAARGFVARGFEQCVVAAKHVEAVLTKLGDVCSSLRSEAVENRFKEAAEDEEFLRQAVAEAEAGTIREDQRRNEDGDDDAKDDFADTVEREEPVRAGLLHEHHDGDGDAGETRAVAEAEESAKDACQQDGEDVVPGQSAEEGE